MNNNNHHLPSAEPSPSEFERMCAEESAKQESQAFKPFSKTDMMAMLPVIVSDMKHNAIAADRKPINANIARDMYAHVIRGLYDEKTFLSHEKLNDGSCREGCFIKGYVRDIWDYLQMAYDLIHKTDFEDILATDQDLILPLKGEYFYQIKAGTKLEEYRLCTPYWKKRLEGRHYRHIILTCGYPKKNDAERRLVLAWEGFTIKTITHPHFGVNPVEVYAIDVSRRIE